MFNIFCCIKKHNDIDVSKTENFLQYIWYFDNSGQVISDL